MATLNVEKSVADFFKANADSDGHVTATQLTQLVQQVTNNALSEASAAKTVRGYLRSLKARNQAEYRGSNWRITQVIASQVVTHFARKLIAS